MFKIVQTRDRKYLTSRYREEEGCMHYRQLGSTGLEISEVGFGTWSIGKSAWLGAEDDESVRTLHKAIDLGLNFMDTALAYGEGHSEQVGTADEPNTHRGSYPLRTMRLLEAPAEKREL